MMGAYYKRLTSTDLHIRSEAAKQWSLWECSTSRLMVDEEYLRKAGEDDFADKFARIELSFFFSRMKSWSRMFTHANYLRFIPSKVPLLCKRWMDARWSAT